MTDSPYAGTTPLSPSDEKLWATLVQVGGIIFGFIPALIGYFVLRERGPFVREHVVTALNWQITLVIAYAVGALTSIILIGIFITIAAAILQLVLGIIASIRASNGQLYQYPLAIRFIKN
jgi:uncharacterized Tic20 family protein